MITFQIKLVVKQEIQKTLSGNSHGAKEGKAVTDNSNQKARNAKEGDPVSLLKHSGRTELGPAGDFPMKPEAQVCNPSFFNYLNKMKLMANNDTDLRSLMDFEELLDKDIKEAQEHRHKCEVEEKDALLTYRRAQGVLIEAHARCSPLYSKRELYSAQLRSFMMENPILFSSQINLDRVEAGIKSFKNVSDGNVPQIPPSDNHVLTADTNKFGYDANVPPANNELQNLLNLHVLEQNVVPDPRHEPDGTPSIV